MVHGESPEVVIGVVLYGSRGKPWSCDRCSTLWFTGKALKLSTLLRGTFFSRAVIALTLPCNARYITRLHRCGHCKRAKPEFTTAATKLYSNNKVGITNFNLSLPSSLFLSLSLSLSLPLFLWYFDSDTRTSSGFVVQSVRAQYKYWCILLG